jgi:hypothetical protein
MYIKTYSWHSGEIAKGLAGCIEKTEGGFWIILGNIVVMSIEVDSRWH